MCFFFSLSVIRLTSFINWLKLISYSFLLAKQTFSGLLVLLWAGTFWGLELGCFCLGCLLLCYGSCYSERDWVTMSLVLNRIWIIGPRSIVIGTNESADIQRRYRQWIVNLLSDLNNSFLCACLAKTYACLFLFANDWLLLQGALGTFLGFLFV